MNDVSLPRRESKNERFWFALAGALLKRRRFLIDLSHERADDDCRSVGD